MTELGESALRTEARGSAVISPGLGRAGRGT